MKIPVNRSYYIKKWAMNRTSDPDFAFFLNPPAHQSNHAEMYERGRLRMRQIARERETSRVEAHMSVIKDCPFRPILTKKGISVSVPFHVRQNTFMARKKQWIVDQHRLKDAFQDSIPFAPNIKATRIRNCSCLPRPPRLLSAVLESRPLIPRINAIPAWMHKTINYASRPVFQRLYDECGNSE